MQSGDTNAPEVPPLAALAVAVLAVSTSAILVRFSDAPSLVKAFYRVLFTVSLLAPVAAARHRGAFERLTRRDALVASVTGVALAVHFAAWFESLDWTSVAASVTLVQSQPLFVVVGAAFLLGERVDRRTAVGIAIAIAGMAAMTLVGAERGATGPRPLYGNALAVVGAVTAAGYVLAGRSLRQRVALVPYVTLVYGVCAASLLAFAVADGVVVSPAAYPPREWALFLAMALGPGILGHTIINWSLEYLDSSVVSVALLGEPVGAALLAVALLGEVPGSGTVAGGAVVLVGIYVTVSARQ